MKRKLDQIDLLLDFLDGKLDKELADDIQNSLPEDPVLNATIDGLEKLYEEHNRDREALRAYFKDAEKRIVSNLEKKANDRKNRKRIIYITLLLVILGLLALLFWYNKGSKTSSTPIENNTIPIENSIDKDENELDEENETTNTIDLDTTNFDTKKSSQPNIQQNLDKDKVIIDTNAIALNLKGGFDIIDHIEPEIGVTLRSGNEPILVENTNYRDRKFISKSNPVIEVVITFKDDVNFQDYLIDFFDYSSFEQEQSQQFKIDKKEMSFVFKVTEGRYYWVISKDGEDEVYGSILVYSKN